MRGRTNSVPAIVYNFGFAFCEVLNLVVILVSQSILNSLFNDEYASYGINVQSYRSFVPNPNLPERSSPANPMCHLFPTEVSCTVRADRPLPGELTDELQHSAVLISSLRLLTLLLGLVGRGRTRDVMEAGLRRRVNNK